MSSFFCIVEIIFVLFNDNATGEELVGAVNLNMSHVPPLFPSGNLCQDGLLAFSPAICINVPGVNVSNQSESLRKQLAKRILVLDGGMGTMIQSYKLEEADYRGARFADWPSDVKGNNDLLLLSRPDVIQAIEKAYLDAFFQGLLKGLEAGAAVGHGDYLRRACIKLEMITKLHGSQVLPQPA